MIELDIRTRRRARKVYYAQYNHDSGPHPVIRLGGKYLVEYGFDVGDAIDVAVSQDQIVISKIEKESQMHRP